MIDPLPNVRWVSEMPWKRDREDCRHQRDLGHPENLADRINEAEVSGAHQSDMTIMDHVWV